MGCPGRQPCRETPAQGDGAMNPLRHRLLAVFAMAWLSFLLSACGGGSAETGPPPPPTPGSLSVSPSPVAFGNELVGTTSSPPQPVTVSNGSSAAFTVTSVSSTGPFAVSGFSGTTTLNPGQQLSLNVTFTPTAAGAANGTLTITGNASNSPASVSLTVALSGTGVSASAGVVCTGTALSQNQTDVTAQLSMVAAGVKVMQLTDNGNNWISYIDIPLYSQLSNVILYDHSKPGQAMTANPDGTNAQGILSGLVGSGYLSFDGTLAYGGGVNPGGTTLDIYAVKITVAGGCQVNRLTVMNLVPVAPLAVVQVSTSSKDTVTGKNVIAFAEGGIIHRVLEDGTLLPDVTPPPGPQQGGTETTFHRLRLNPRFPNLLFYKWNQPNNTVGEKELWLLDLDHPQVAYNVDTAFGSLSAVSHPVWAPDGTQIGYQGNNTGQWYVATVVNSDGTIQPVPFTNNVFIGPGMASGLNAEYCNWAPDKSQFICTSNKSFGGKIYTMALDGSSFQVLAATDAQSLTDSGLPLAQFFLDTQHILFRSDRTGTPQVYGLTRTSP